MRLNHERSFFENRKNCSPSALWASSTEAAYSEHSIAIHSISLAGYVNAILGFVCFELPAQEAVIFENWKFNRIYLLFELVKDKCTLSVSKYDSCWCFGFQWVTLWRSDKFLLTLSVDSEWNKLCHPAIWWIHDLLHRPFSQFWTRCDNSRGVNFTILKMFSLP